VVSVEGGVFLMLKAAQVEKARERASQYLKRARILVTDKERENIEVADFGLGKLRSTGLQVLVYVNTRRCCAKELVLFRGQTCPEHLHPDMDGEPGKEETFRCRWGTVYLYVPGEPASDPKAFVAKSKKKYYTVWHEIILNAGDQYTLAPNTLHWFQGGEKGAVVSEFSTRNTDERDIFTDPAIRRIPEVEK
jgi:D-lyxose ketol-isomerase